MKLTGFIYSFCSTLIISYIWDILDVQNYTEIDLIGKYLGDVRQLCLYTLKYKMHMLKMVLSNNIFNWNQIEKVVSNMKYATRLIGNKDVSN